MRDVKPGPQALIHRSWSQSGRACLLGPRVEIAVGQRRNLGGDSCLPELDEARRRTAADPRGSQLFFVGTTYIDVFTSETSLRVVRSGANRSVRLLDASSENCQNVGYCRETLDMIRLARCSS